MVRAIWKMCSLFKILEIQSEDQVYDQTDKITKSSCLLIIILMIYILFYFDEMVIFLNCLPFICLMVFCNWRDNLEEVKHMLK